MVQIVLSALSKPQDFVERAPSTYTFAALALGASVGVASYGGAIHVAEGVPTVLAGALRALAVAAVAWMLAVPALVVIGPLLGSPSPWRRVVFASLVAVNFGGLAFMASIPVVGLLEMASPFAWTRPLVNSLVVGAVGGTSTLIFERAMATIEGQRGFHRVWMGVFGVLFVEFAWFIDLFRFTS